MVMETNHVHKLVVILWLPWQLSLASCDGVGPAAIV